jgi:hypothetical protein
MSDFKETKIFYQGKEHQASDFSLKSEATSWFSIDLVTSNSLVDAWALVNSDPSKSYNLSSYTITYDEANQTFYKTETTTNNTPPRNPHYDELAKLVPALENFILNQCPEFGRCPPCNLKNAIIHLNDKHRWDRLAIADWLDTLDIDLTIQVKGNNDEG